MTKFCPKCGGEVPDEVTICLNCGANTDDEPDIDNSDEIAKMLAGDKVVVDTDDLNDEQMEAFEAGKAIEFSPGDLSEDALNGMSAMDDMPIDELLSEEGGDIISDTPPPSKKKKVTKTVSLEAPPEEEKAPPPVTFSAPEEPEHHDDDDDILIQGGVTHVSGFRLPQTIKNILILFFLAAAMFVLGYFASTLMKGEVFIGYATDIGFKSLRATMPRIPEGTGFRAYDIYVKRDIDITECIIFGVSYTEANNYTPTYYRLRINNRNFSDARLFYPFDQDEYDMLIQGSEESQLRALTMMSYYNDFLRSVDEINAEDTRWMRADITLVNTMLAREG